jgi:hypothetical protein
MTAFGSLLEALTSAEVEFIIVGGLAATVHGSARLTQDIDPSQARRRPAQGSRSHRGAGSSRGRRRRPVLILRPGPYAARPSATTGQERHRPGGRPTRGPSLGPHRTGGSCRHLRPALRNRRWREPPCERRGPRAGPQTAGATVPLCSPAPGGHGAPAAAPRRPCGVRPPWWCEACWRRVGLRRARESAEAVARCVCGFWKEGRAPLSTPARGRAGCWRLPG